MARRNPYPVLLVAAAIPALILTLVARYAADRTDGGAAPATTTTTSVVSGTPAASGGGTPVLSTRRTPGVLSAVLNVDDLATALKPVEAMLPAAGCLAVSVNGEAVTDRRGDAVLRPASNVKLLVGAAANDVLGAGFTYTTSVRAAVGANGVVDGNLYLVGGGDPVLSEPWWKDSTITLLPPSVITDITALADSVVAAGVRQVTGGVVGDGSRYDDERFAPTVTQKVKAELEALPVSALVVNDTRIDDQRVAEDPNRGAAQVFARLLKERGVDIAGDSSSGTAPAHTPEVAKIASAPFPQILHEMLSQSDNLSAEMITKELAVAKGQPGTRENGLQTVVATVGGWGIDVSAVTLVDGSGLSDENRMTCDVLLGVLQHGRFDDPVGAGLAVAGQDGTTLAGALDDTPVKGRLRAKTGTLTNADGVANKPGAKTLAGYLPLEGGGQIEFAMLLNGEDITTKTVYRPIWNRFAEVIAAYPKGASVADLGPATAATPAAPATDSSQTESSAQPESTG